MSQMRGASWPSVAPLVRPVPPGVHAGLETTTGELRRRAAEGTIGPDVAKGKGRISGTRKGGYPESEAAKASVTGAWEALMFHDKLCA